MIYHQISRAIILVLRLINPTTWRLWRTQSMLESRTCLQSIQFERWTFQSLLLVLYLLWVIPVGQRSLQEFVLWELEMLIVRSQACVLLQPAFVDDLLRRFAFKSWPLLLFFSLQNRLLYFDTDLMWLGCTRSRCLVCLEQIVLPSTFTTFNEVLILRLFLPSW